MNPRPEYFIFLQTHSCCKRYLCIDNLCDKFINQLYLSQDKSLLQEHNKIYKELEGCRIDRRPVYEAVPSDQVDVVVRHDCVDQKEFSCSLFYFYLLISCSFYLVPIKEILSNKFVKHKHTKYQSEECAIKQRPSYHIKIEKLLNQKVHFLILRFFNRLNSPFLWVKVSIWELVDALPIR